MEGLSDCVDHPVYDDKEEVTFREQFRLLAKEPA